MKHIKEESIYIYERVNKQVENEEGISFSRREWKEIQECSHGCLPLSVKGSLSQFSGFVTCEASAVEFVEETKENDLEERKRKQKKKNNDKEKKKKMNWRRGKRSKI